MLKKRLKIGNLTRGMGNDLYMNSKIMDMIKRMLDWIRPKSPCCEKPMTSVLEMELDTLLYECPKCGEEWI